MINEIIQAFILIFIAEMGDKTQILALAFATRYPVKKVLLGVVIGAFLNHGIAVVLGSRLTSLVPIDTIQIAAGAAFVIFGLWSLRIEEDGEEDEAANGRYGAVLTVALAFFIGELGDKTQLAAITLAAESTNFLYVLAGTVSGMAATSCLGIFVGKKIGDRIPEIWIKTVAAFIFLVFGSLKLYMALPKAYVNMSSIIFYIMSLTAVSVLMFRKSYASYKSGPVSKYRRASKRLHEYYSDMEVEIEKLCRGKGICGKCDGTRCPVGNTRALIREGLTGNEKEIGEVDQNLLESKSFEGGDLDSMIEKTIAAREASEGRQRRILGRILSNMERIRLVKK